MLDNKKTRKIRGLNAPFSPELGNQICDQIESGMSITQICKADYMPDKATLLKWSVDPDKGEFGNQYARAYRIRILAQIEERDELAMTEINARTVEEIAKQYDISLKDDKMLSLYIRSDLNARQVDRKTRLDHLGKSIGQLLQVFDKRFTSKEALTTTNKQTFLISTYSAPEEDNNEGNNDGKNDGKNDEGTMRSRI